MAWSRLALKRGCALERQRHRLHQEDRQREIRAPVAALLLAASHGLELGDVGEVVLGDVRDHGPGEREVLGAAAADAAKGLPLDGPPLLEPRERREGDRSGQGPGRFHERGGRGSTGLTARGRRCRRPRAPRRRRGRRPRSGGGPADVVVGDPAARPRPADLAEVHPQLPREAPGRGRGGRREPGGGRRSRRSRSRGRASRGGGRRSRRGRDGRRGRPRRATGIREAQQDGADLDPLPRPDVDPVDPAAEWRRQLDLGLLGLHHEDGLVFLDLLPFRDQDADDLRLGEAFPEIGQPEISRHRGWRVRPDAG